VIRVQLPRDNRPREVRIPARAAPFIWAVSYSLVHVGLPWALSLLSPRLGWASHQPGVANLGGIVPVAAGALCVVWALSHHFAQLRLQEHTHSFGPYLLVQGPYAFSRNPLYVSAFSIWIGWSLFYGSPTVLFGFLALLAALVLRAVPSEERRLEAQFGEDYDRYSEAVPRWISIRPRR
jgi:protein-S-isoprenylcysteine O-methyltransferase Ste14